MIIESVAAASAALGALSNLIKQANEAGTGMQQLMGTISEFGEALDSFELQRKSSTFKQLNQSELLRLQMIRKSYDRYWKDVNDLLAMVDPELLADFKKAKAEQEERRKQHLRFLERKRKERAQLIEAILWGTVTFILAGAVLAGIMYFILEPYF